VTEILWGCGVTLAVPALLHLTVMAGTRITRYLRSRRT
jgi:hypothetical protein